MPINVFYFVSHCDAWEACWSERFWDARVRRAARVRVLRRALTHHLFHLLRTLLLVGAEVELLLVAPQHARPRFHDSLGVESGGAAQQQQVESRRFATNAFERNVVLPSRS